MKPEKFNGSSSFETFMCTFNTCAEYNKWSMDDKAAFLRWSLSGPAAQLLWSTDSLSYDELVEKLRARYGTKGIEERFQTELRCRRRQKNESIRELAQDVQRLVSLAYPGEKSKMLEHFARDSFITALDDPDLEIRIREREPEDLDTAVKYALRSEVVRNAVRGSHDAGRPRASRQVMEDNQPEYGAVDCIKTMIDEAVQQRLAHIPAMTASNDQSSGGSRCGEQPRHGGGEEKPSSRNGGRRTRAVERELDAG